MCGVYCTPHRLRGKNVSNTCAQAKGQPCQSRSVRPRDRSNHEPSGLVAAERHLRGDTSLEGSPVEERRPKGRGECQSWQNAKSSEKNAEDEEMEGEVVQDLNGDVHMKLSVPLVSRENSVPARVCNCTVFQPRKSAIIPKMQVSRPAVTKWPSKCGARTWEALLRLDLLALSLDLEPWIRSSCVFLVSSCH